MKFTAATLMTASAVSASLLDLSVNLPLGLDIDLDVLGSRPSEEPCHECTDIWHPPHEVEIDDCDDTHNGDWHWVHPCQECHHETTYSWTLSTITATHVNTIIDCGPDVPDCPAGATTVTVSAETTVCPIPVVPTVPVVPTTQVVVPPTVPTSEIIVPVHPPATEVIPPPVYTNPGVVVPPPVYTQPPATLSISVGVPVPPPAGTPVAPPVVPGHPAPPANSPVAPVTPPNNNPVTPPTVPVTPPTGGNGTVTPPPAPTAGAAKTAQSVGALLAFGLFAAALL